MMSDFKCGPTPAPETAIVEVVIEVNGCGAESVALACCSSVGSAFLLLDMASQCHGSLGLHSLGCSPAWGVVGFRCGHLRACACKGVVVRCLVWHLSAVGPELDFRVFPWVGC